MPTQKARDLAQRLLAYETDSGNASGVDVPAVLQVSEKLRRPLSTLAGVAGFRALLARALTLAKTQTPSLKSARVMPDGSLDGLTGLRREEASQAGILLIAQLLELLTTFIGETLMLRTVQDGWPDLAFNDSNSEETNQYGRR